MAQVVYTSLTGTATAITFVGGNATVGSAVSAGNIDVRSGGTTNLVQQLQAMFQLAINLASTTGIVAGFSVADLYLVPFLDGTNAASINTTTGSSYIPSNYLFGSFIAPSALSSSTDYLLVTAIADLFPGLYSVYIFNQSGPTITSPWQLKILVSSMQSN